MAIGLENEGFSDALVILGAAGLVIPAFARFRVSPVIGFILVGVLVDVAQHQRHPPQARGVLAPGDRLQDTVIDRAAALERRHR